MSDSRTDIARRWSQVENPKHLRITIPIPNQPTVTCVEISNGRIIVATDTASILVYSADTGRLLHTLHGHQSGVWAMKTTEDTLVSGSTDKTIRIWDLYTGRCTHVYAGHQGTVRCLSIIQPEWNNYRDPETRTEKKELWPARPYLVSGSRDCSVRLWSLPRQGEESMSWDNTKRNPHHKFSWKEHENGIKDIAARGRFAVSASYDSTLRVWDLVKGTCPWVLRGHTERVQTVIIDPYRPQAYSASADTSIRIWDIWTGECLHVLTGHTEIVGVLTISQSFLVSAAADESVRIWDPDTGLMINSFQGGTTADHHRNGLFCGSNSTGALQLRRMKDGRVLHTFKGPSQGCWITVFDPEGKYCVSAGAEETSAVLDVWNFVSSDEMDVDQN